MRDFDAIKKKEMSSIENRVRHVYNIGYETGYAEGQKHDLEHTENIVRSHEKCKSVLEAEYERGLKDAWECCKRFWQSDENTCRDIFNIICWEDFFDLSPSEAIEKFKEFDEKHFVVPDNCKIEVGDEVYVPEMNEYEIVIEIVSDDDGDFVRIIRSNGKPLLCVKDTVNLTGNHCDSIVDLLKRLEKRNA